MAYSVAQRESAFRKYLIRGESPEQISEQLRGENGGKGPSANTVRKWKDTPDAEGKTWEDYRTEVDEIARSRTLEHAASRRARKREQAAIISETMFDQIVEDGAPKIKEPTNAARVFKEMSKFELEIDDEERNFVPPATVAHSILQFLSQDKEIAKVLKARWAHVRKFLSDEIPKLSDAAVSTTARVEGE